MKFAILPLTVFVTVIAVASFKKNKTRPKENIGIKAEWKDSHTMETSLLVNEIFFDFVKRQLTGAFDGRTL